jgi:hypothetical protein
VRLIVTYPTQCDEIVYIIAPAPTPVLDMVNINSLSLAAVLTHYNIIDAVAIIVEICSYVRGHSLAINFDTG